MIIQSFKRSKQFVYRLVEKATEMNLLNIRRNFNLVERNETVLDVVIPYNNILIHQNGIQTYIFKDINF